MRKLLVLAFALLLITVIHVVPTTDLSDGDGGFSYAILAKNHFHPPANSNGATLPSQRAVTPTVRQRPSFLPNEGTVHCRPLDLATVLRC